MKKYELGVILHPSLEEEVIKTETEQLTELINRFGGIIEKVDSWGKKKLAYEIKKLKEGYYFFFTINAEETLPAEIESRIRIKENIIRFLLINKEN